MTKVKAEVKPVKTATPEKSGEEIVKAIAKQGAAVAKDAKKVLAETKVIPIVSVQDRFDALEQFQALERKHVSIKSKSQQLKVLRKANDQTGAEISIEANGEKISLNNGSIVEEVLNLLDSKLETLNRETEKEVLEFVV